MATQLAFVPHLPTTASGGWSVNDISSWRIIAEDIEHTASKMQTKSLTHPPAEPIQNNLVTYPPADKTLSEKLMYQKKPAKSRIY
jgi:hypothetical protein